MNRVFHNISTSVLMMIFIFNSQSVLAQVDFSGFWGVNFGKVVSSSELLSKIPKEAIFIDDSGSGELSEGDYSGLVLSEKAMGEVRDYNFNSEFDILNTCLKPSSAFYMQAPFPIEIHQSESLLVLKMEYFDMVRLIFMDGREIPDDSPHNKNGYSVGYWDGDELVVRTERISSSTFMNNGFNHSENIIMHERFKISEDKQTLWLIQTYEDPEVFAGIGARYMSWKKQEGEYVYPYDCDLSFAL